VAQTDFLIIGGGLAGVSAAETLRRLLPRATIAIVSGEIDPPHDRPPLSKEFLRGEKHRDAVLLHPIEFYQANRLNLLLGTPALALDAEAGSVLLADGERLGYQRLLLATGGRPKKLGVPGETMPGVYELRTLGEAERIRDATFGATHVVVIGAGFIGLEVAASLAVQGIEVTVLNLDDQLWPGVMPPAVAALIQRDMEARGVRFRHCTRVTGFEGKDTLERILTNAGDLDASVAVVGAGIQLNVELAAGAGLAIDDGIVVDEYLRTSASGIFAAGDVACFPDSIGGTSDRPARRHVEHWDNAIAQGKVAAANMAGRTMAYRRVPYFWSDVFDTSINVVGYLDAADELLIRGSVEARRFSLLALRDGALRGALLVNNARDRRAAAELVMRRTPILDHRDRLADPSFKLAALVPAE